MTGKDNLHKQADKTSPDKAISDNVSLDKITKPDGNGPDGNGADAIHVEKGGPKGPEPTRHGDWEYGGRCTDF